MPDKPASIPSDPAARGGGARSKTASTIIMLVATDLLLPLLFPPFYCWFFAFIALVPLSICILRRPMRPRYIFFYYLAGAGFFLPNLYWLAPVTVAGYILLALYLGIYFPLFAFGLHRLVNGLRVPATLAVPIAWVAVEYVRSTFLEGGFPWFMLGNSFAKVPLLIQTADLFGVWGVTFWIAMVNGAIVDILRLPLKREGRFNLLIGRIIAATMVVSVSAIGYGVFRMQEKTIQPGPRVAVLQENIPQEVKDDPKNEGLTFSKYLALAKKASSEWPRPDLVAWPETTTEPINREVLDMIARVPPEKLFEAGKRIARCDLELRRLADSSGAAQLAGVPGRFPRGDDLPDGMQNLTLLYEPEVGQTDEVYAKVHLVPFGEYIPFRGLPLVGPYMVYISPWKDPEGNRYDYSNVPGTRWTRFRLGAKQSRNVLAPGTAPASLPATLVPAIETTTKFYTFATPICFEDTMPEPARKMTAPQFAPFGTSGKTDFLINVSNDGWFYPVELEQRMQASQLRAVENRVPIARAVNTGNSGFIDSCGRIVKLVQNAAGESIGAVGTASLEMPLDSRVTLFSRIGDLLPIVCGIAGILGIGWTFVRPRRGVPAQAEPAPETPEE